MNLLTDEEFKKLLSGPLDGRLEEALRFVINKTDAEKVTLGMGTKALRDFVARVILSP